MCRRSVMRHNTKHAVLLRIRGLCRMHLTTIHRAPILGIIWDRILPRCHCRGCGREAPRGCHGRRLALREGAGQGSRREGSRCVTSTESDSEPLKLLTT